MKPYRTHDITQYTRERDNGHNSKCSQEHHYSIRIRNIQRDQLGESYKNEYISYCNIWQTNNNQQRTPM